MRQPTEKPEVPLRTRFAPSPTGYLHLGHVLAAAYVWGIGRALGAEIVLRIEDHDRMRCRKIFEQALIEDLQWLGLTWDFGPGSTSSPFRQSDCYRDYEFRLQELKAKRAVFRCSCSRKVLQQRLMRTHPSQLNGELAYDGHCRQRSITEGSSAGIRLYVEGEEVFFKDLLCSPQKQVPAEQCGDLLLVDRHGHWTYHFANVVDDLHQQITLVIRGIDLLDSTGRQLYLRSKLGDNRHPVYMHHPLIHGPDGEKLSKRHQAKPVRSYRAEGWSAERVLGHALKLGRLGRGLPLSASELSAFFEEELKINERVRVCAVDR